MQIKTLKSGYKLLYYVLLGAVIMNFMGYPLHSMVKMYTNGIPNPALSKFSAIPNPLIIHEEQADYEEEHRSVITGKQLRDSEKTEKVSGPQKDNEQKHIEFHSEDRSGIIGYDPKINADDPSDNIFSFPVDKEKIRDKTLYLSYEVYGIENVSGISRSINQFHSNGGYMVKENREWTQVEEVISADQLKNGRNQVLFTVPANESLFYKVRNLKVVAAPVKEADELLYFADEDKLYINGDKAYVKGVVAKSGLSLSINGKEVPVINNEFEMIISDAGQLTEWSVELKDKKGNPVFEKVYPIRHKINADKEIAYKTPDILQKIHQNAEGNFYFSLEEVDFQLHKEDYEQADKITLQKLRNIDIAPLGTGIINVTTGKIGFRFLPEGAKFKNKAKITLQFDKTLLPKGYSENDIQILYFDTAKRGWLAIPRDSVDIENQKVIASTDHFTDYIAGVIQSPESPEADSFTPTSISDIKIADPTAGIVQIAPPTANQKGDGAVEFPILVPPGRNGVQPNLALTYNNNGTSSIAGYGWDLSVPYISVDTKYGIPQYSASSETESYLMNGEELLLKAGNELYLPHRTTSLVGRVNNAVFYPKHEGSFSRIERKGNHPSSYYWEVWDKSGTKYTYGEQAGGRLSSGNIAKWMLEKVEDKNGNYMVYTYTTKNYTSGNLSGGQEILLASIEYSLHPEYSMGEEFHNVSFTYGEGRTDQTLNYRYGFKEVNAAYLSGIKVSSPLISDRCFASVESHFMNDIYDEIFFEVHYDLNYTQGPFGKKLLNSVTTTNKKINYETNSTVDSESYTHTFDYYDDIQSGGLFGPEEHISTKDDLDKELSVLGGTMEKDVLSGSIDLSAGIFFPGLFPSYIPISNAGTVSFSFPFPTSVDSKMDLTLIDIDGDGLPDKVVKKGDAFKYRKNLGSGEFSNLLYDIHNFHGISSSRTRTTYTAHPSFSFLIANTSRSESHSVSESNIFLTDVNADGLVDYVKDRIVYFNRIDPATGLPNFTANSDLTPNRIFKEGDVDEGVLAPLPDLELGNDLMDVVKVWIAPKNGKINISGVISKPYVETTNGVRYSIEHSTLFSDFVPIDPLPGNPGTGGNGPVVIGGLLNGGGYIKNPTLLVTATENTDFSNVTVRRGDMIFFRVNSSQIPLEELPQVTWDPEINYVEQDFDSPNQYKQYSSKYSDSYVYGDAVTEPLLIKKSGIYFLRNDPFTINNSGQVPELTDDVWIKVTVYRPDTTDAPATEVVLSAAIKTIYRDEFNTVNSFDVPVPLLDINEDDPDTYVYVKAEILSDSQINWKIIDDKLRLNLYNLNFSEDNWLTPRYQTFPNQVTRYYKSTFPSAATVAVKHNFQLEHCAQGLCEDQYVYLVVKNEQGRIVNAGNNRPAKYRYKLASNGSVSEVLQLSGYTYSLQITANQTDINVAGGTSLYFEYYTETPRVANAVNRYQNEYNDLLATTTGPAAQSDYIDGGSNTGLYKANIFYSQNLRGAGTLYRNWGQFAYKGAGPQENFERIKRSYIGLSNMIGLLEDEDGEGEISEEELSDQADYIENTDPSNFEYDEESGTYIDPNNQGNGGMNITNHQIQAMKHFTTLKPDRAGEVWKSHSRLYLGAQKMSPYLRYDIGQEMQSLNIPAPVLNSAYGAVSIVRQSVSKSHGESVSAGFGIFGIGSSTTSATTKILNDYQDVNGDGYPDIIGQQVQLTTYRGGLSNQVWNQDLLFESSTSGSGSSLSGGSTTTYVNTLNKITDVRIGRNDSYSAQIGGNGIATTTKDDRILLDINGDGLADQISANGAIEFNTGNGFVASDFMGFGESSGVQTKLSGLSGGIGSSYLNDLSSSESLNIFSNLDFSFGIAGSNSSSVVTKNFIDINGDGLPDYIDNGNIRINSGTGFLNHQYNLPKHPESYTYQVGTSFNLIINIMITFGPFPIGIKFGGGGGANLVNTYNAELTKYVDFDGDGYPDMLHSTDEESLTVRYSRIARTNMLKTIQNPTGSVIEMDYDTKNAVSDQRFGNNYKMPFKKWVLSSVKVHDGFSGDGADVQQYAFEYRNGYKDRRERKFLGFGEVLTHQLSADGSIYRSSVSEYMLNRMPQSDIYLPGSTSDSRKYQYLANLLVKETTKDASNRIFSISENEYSMFSLPANPTANEFDTANNTTVTYTDNSRILPLVKRTRSTVYHYQGNATNNPYTVVNEALFEKYDKYGNVTIYRDVSDQVGVTIEYHYADSPQQYNVSVPKKHVVTDLAQNSVRRRSETTVTPQFNIASISRYRTFEGAGQVAITDYAYDPVGNMVKVTFPKPTMNAQEEERYFIEYEYDCRFRNFVYQTTDAYGYSSQKLYTNFGMPVLQKDINGSIFNFKYDGMRRITEFKGPYNGEWTIRHSYLIQPDGLRYAVTEHNIQDEQDPDLQNPQEPMILHTSSFADGLGRITQTKKQLDLAQECATDETPLVPGVGYRFAVSGNVVYDAFGRVTETYLSQEEVDCYEDFLTGLHKYSELSHTDQEKSSVFYDTQDRVLQSHIHGLNATTTYEYGFGFDGTTPVHKAKETITLPEGNSTETYKDHKGRMTATKQINTGTGDDLLTRYTYSALGELMQVRDAEDQTTDYTYDSFGNKVAVRHPDNGISDFTYDLTGKIAKSRNQNLIDEGLEVTYDYHFNQLTAIHYPSHTVEYTYGAGGNGYNDENNLGRLTTVTDLTGIRGFKYGKLGEVVTEYRLLMSEEGHLFNKHEFRYDSWGRIRNMSYVDGERLIYSYNAAGQLKNIANAEDFVYLEDVKYNFFDQPTEIVYGNGVKTTNEYDITQRIRAMQLDRPDASTFMRNIYSYDRNQNITRIENNYSQHDIIRMGGVFSKKYEYDTFNRLAYAEGGWSGYEEYHEYKLNMNYNATHSIVNKNQYHYAQTAVSSGETLNSYHSDYFYDDQQHPHAPSRIDYAQMGSVDFKYDANGNIEHIRNQTALMPWEDREMIWDEQNRLMAVIDDQSTLSHYGYDHAGERTFKSEGHIDEINIAGENIYKLLHLDNYLLYPSGYAVFRPSKDEFIKHYYINNKRFVSRIVSIPYDAIFIPDEYDFLLSSGSLFQESTFDRFVRDNEVMLPKSLYSSISIDNDPQQCNDQLDQIEQMYDTPDTQVCLQQIQDIRALAENTPCDALILINSITFVNCAGNDPDPNQPDPDVDPKEEYTEEQLSEFDCLSQLNILIGGFYPLLGPATFSYTTTSVPQEECESVCYGNCYIACDGDPDCIAYCYGHCINSGCDTFPTPDLNTGICEFNCYDYHDADTEEEELAYCLFKCRDDETPQNDCEMECYYNCNGDPNCMASCYYECSQDPDVIACKVTCESLCEGDPECTQYCIQAFCDGGDGTPCGVDCYDRCKSLCDQECNGDPDCVAACIPDCMEVVSEDIIKQCKLQCLEDCNGDLNCLLSCILACGVDGPDPGNSCEENAMYLVQQLLMLEPQMTACQVLWYLNEYYYPCEEPEVPVGTPPDHVDIGDGWTDGGGNSGNPDDPLALEPQEPVWWYHSDHLGSSTYLTDIFGRPRHYYETLPFGEMMVEHNQSLYEGLQYGDLKQYDNPHKFNGKELDDATQMYYYGARYYDPKFSIFVSVDPLAESTMEPYSYVGNNPIMFTDPTGMSKEGVETIFPRLVKENKNGNVIAKPGVFTKKFHGQMQRFMSTDIGKSYISSFMKKGENFMGYRAKESGKLSNYDLRIAEMNIKEPSARGAYMRNDGSFSYGIDSDTGNLYFQLKIDSNLSPDKILETIGHELMLHGYKASQIAEYYEKNGKDKFINAMKNGEFPSGNDDHKAIRDWDCTHQGLNNYESFMNEVTGKNKKMEKTFENEKKHYNDIYKGR